MGCPDPNKNSPFYAERLSLNIIPLRPSQEILTVPAVNITQYWSDSVCGWEPHIKRHGRLENPKRRGRERAKYACDASPRTANVQAKHNEMERDGICRNVRRVRVKK
eukprot:6177247-Pleurochrysis_carterae.AAC.1